MWYIEVSILYWLTKQSKYLSPPPKKIPLNFLLTNIRNHWNNLHFEVSNKIGSFVPKIPASNQHLQIIRLCLPIKFRYPSPPSPMVISLIILWRAMPLSMIRLGGDIVDMWVYISLSISQKARVLSPTRAWSWLSAYAMHFSPYRRFDKVWQIFPTSQLSSDTSFKYWK